MPLVTNGDRGSFGTAFLLTVMWLASSAASAALPGQSLVAQIDQKQVVVGSARDHRVAAFREHRDHRPRVGDDLLLVGAKTGLHRFFEGHCLGRNDVHQRAALGAREYE